MVVIEQAGIIAAEEAILAMFAQALSVPTAAANVWAAILFLAAKGRKNEKHI